MESLAEAQKTRCLGVGAKNVLAQDIARDAGIQLEFFQIRRYFPESFSALLQRRRRRDHVDSIAGLERMPMHVNLPGDCGRGLLAPPP